MILLLTVLLVLVVSVLITAHYTRLITGIFLIAQIEASSYEGQALRGRPVSFSSRDGLPLKGTLIAGGDQNRKPAVIFCHEVGAGKESVAKYASFLAKEGYTLFSFDFRSQGESAAPDGYEPKQWATKGELDDLQGAIDWIHGEVSPSVVLFGISKGGVTALCAAAERPVKGVISDGAFSTRWTLKSYVDRWKEIFFPVRIPRFIIWYLRAFALWLGERKIGYPLLHVEKVVSRLSDVPTFFIHGEKDSYISAEQAERLYESAAGEKRLWIVPGARHNQAVRIAGDKYRGRILDFLEACS